MIKCHIDTQPREDQLGKITFMARSDGYVMCRRPHCMPFVLAEKEWTRLPLHQANITSENSK